MLSPPRGGRPGGGLRLGLGPCPDELAPDRHDAGVCLGHAVRAVPRALEGDTRHDNRTLRRWSHGHLRRCRSCNQVGGAAPTGPREPRSSRDRPDARERAWPTTRSSTWQHCTSDCRAHARLAWALLPAGQRLREARRERARLLPRDDPAHAAPAGKGLRTLLILLDGL